MAQIQREKTAVLSVSLPKSLRREILAFNRKREVPVSQWVKEALKRQLWLDQFKEIRKVMVPAFKKLGIKTDEDVEKYFG